MAFYTTLNRSHTNATKLNMKCYTICTDNLYNTQNYFKTTTNNEQRFICNKNFNLGAAF